MFEKTKSFVKEHKNKIIIGIGLVAVAAIGYKVLPTKEDEKDPDDVERILETFSNVEALIDPDDREILEGYGAEYRVGSCVPYASKEVAEKFLERQGDTYQIDILDKETSCIWISGEKPKEEDY